MVSGFNGGKRGAVGLEIQQVFEPPPEHGPKGCLLPWLGKYGEAGWWKRKFFQILVAMK
jgi:hypothetical protein